MIFERGGLKIKIKLKSNHSFSSQNQICGLLCGFEVNKSISTVKMTMLEIKIHSFLLKFGKKKTDKSINFDNIKA